MKYCILILDGAAEELRDEPGAKTALEAAATPNLDRVGLLGRQGTMQPVPEGIEPGSDVMMLSVLGVDPAQGYTGRGPFEAAGLGIGLGPDEVAFCASLVTVVEDRLLDATAGGIQQREAAALVRALDERLAAPDLAFRPGIGHENLMVYSGREDVSAGTVSPSRIVGREIGGFLPRGPGAEFLRRLMDQSGTILEAHDVNLVRIDHGEPPATMVWLWGGGKTPTPRTFSEQFGRGGALVSDSAAARGIAKYLGLEPFDIRGDAEGPPEPAAMAEAALALLDRHDVVVLHVALRVDSTGSADVQSRARAVEALDADVVGRVLGDRLDQGDFQVLVAAFPGEPGAAGAGPPASIPFAICGTDVLPVHELPFSERHAAGTGLQIEHGHELMAYFLRE